MSDTWYTQIKLVEILLKSSKLQPINDSTIYNAFSRVTAREGAATFFLPTEFVSHSTNICE